MRALDRGSRLVAIGYGLLESLLAGEFLRGQSLLANEFQFGPLGAGLRRDHLRLGLIDVGLLGDDLTTDAIDRGLLGRRLFARGVDGETVVAVVDGGDDVAGADASVVLDRDAGDIAGDLRRESRIVGTHIGVVGRNDVAAIEPPPHPEHTAGCKRDRDRRCDQSAPAEPRPAQTLRRVVVFSAAGRNAGRGQQGPPCLRLQSPAIQCGERPMGEVGFVVPFAIHVALHSQISRAGHIPKLRAWVFLTEPFGQSI